MTVIPLVEYSCGCVGFVPSEGTNALIVWNCDAQSSRESLWGVRDMEHKTWTPLSAERAAKHVERFARESAEASHWRELKYLLGRSD